MIKLSLKSSLCSFSLMQAAFLQEDSTIRFAGLNATNRKNTIAPTQSRATTFNCISNNFDALCSMPHVFGVNHFVTSNIW